MNRERFSHHYDDCGYPFLWVSFYHKDKATIVNRAFLDSGASMMMLPINLAKYLGLELKLIDKPFKTAGGDTKGIQAIVDKVRIGRSNIAEFNNVTVGVNELEDTPVLVGITPFFEEYTVIIDGARKYVECIRADCYEKAKKKKPKKKGKRKR